MSTEARGSNAIPETGADRLVHDLCLRIEEDLREPDKLLCHLAWARRILDDRQWQREDAGEQVGKLPENIAPLPAVDGL